MTSWPCQTSSKLPNIFSKVLFCLSVLQEVLLFTTDGHLGMLTTRKSEGSTGTDTSPYCSLRTPEARNNTRFLPLKHELHE